jgi:hypothetical protein
VEGALRQRDDRGSSALRVRQHALRRNPDHPVPAFFNEFLAPVIIGRPLSHVVGDTIDLDDQPGTKAAKIGDIWAYGMLPPEFYSAWLSPKRAPERAFRQ